MMNESLMERAAGCSRAHRAAVEDWKDGAIAKAWIDMDGNLCIEYKSGRWWHYNNGEWW
jgi:hypothetical protein